MTEKVKQDILSFLGEINADVGHAFPAKLFFARRAKNYSPPEMDAVELALDELVSSGTLEKRDDGYFLTESGLHHVYPEGERTAVESVKSDILDFLRAMNARKGHAFPARPFSQKRLANYNPKQNGALDSALTELVSEGILEDRDGAYFVTGSGYRAIYGL